MTDTWIFGCNIGNGGLGPDYRRDTWTTGWDWDDRKDRVDKIADLGCDSIRISGRWNSYNANPRDYKRKFIRLIDYCIEKNLKILYSWQNPNLDVVSTADRVAKQAMIRDLGTPYLGRESIWIGWDVGNEFVTETDATHDTVARNTATDLRAFNPNVQITCSGNGGGGSGLNIDHITDVDDFVDFHDVHIYTKANNDSFHHNWMDDIRGVTSKPVLIGEFGFNTALGSYSNRDQQNYFRALRRYFFGGNLMGVMAWAIKDDDQSVLKYGLYDFNGVEKSALTEYRKYAQLRFDTADDRARFQPFPIVIGSFGKANGSAVTAVLGGAPTTTLGTWDIQSRAARVSVGDAGGQNVLIWDTNTADVDIEAEFVPAATYNFGVIARYTDTSNYTIAKMVSPETFQTLEVVAGVTTNLVAPGEILGITIAEQVRIRLSVRNQVVTVYLNDSFIGQYRNRTAGNTVTKHGLWIRTTGGTIDTGTTIKRFSISVPIRTY